MRNASAREQKRVYMRVIDRAIEEQRKIIRKDEEIEVMERAGKDASGGPVQGPA